MTRRCVYCAGGQICSEATSRSLTNNASAGRHSHGALWLNRRNFLAADSVDDCSAQNVTLVMC